MFKCTIVHMKPKSSAKAYLPLRQYLMFRLFKFHLPKIMQLVT